MNGLIIGALIRLRSERTITSPGAPARAVDTLRVFAVHSEGDAVTVDAEDPAGSGAFWTIGLDDIEHVVTDADVRQEQADYEAYLDYLGDQDEAIGEAGNEVSA